MLPKGSKVQTVYFDSQPMNIASEKDKVRRASQNIFHPKNTYF
jgi:hypothetical protein